MHPADPFCLRVSRHHVTELKLSSYPGVGIVDDGWLPVDSIESVASLSGERLLITHTICQPPPILKLPLTLAELLSMVDHFCFRIHLLSGPVPSLRLP